MLGHLKKSLFIWFLTLGIITGLNLRVFAMASGCTSIRSETECHSCEHQEALSAEHHSHEDSEGDPLHHHHHEGCVHSLPLTVGRDSTIVLLVPVCLSQHLRPESEVAPDSPFLSSEKPPLI